MQLSLLSRLTRRADAPRHGPSSTVPGAWRDSAISQLDRIADANEAQIARARRRRRGWAIALCATALLVLSTHWWPVGDMRTPLATLPAAPAQGGNEVAPAPTSVVEAPPMAAQPTAPTPDRMPTEVPPAVMHEVAPMANTVADEAKAGALEQQAADARRARARQLAQERARASEEAQLLKRAQEQQQQAQAEQARQQALQAERLRAAAADRAGQEATERARQEAAERARQEAAPPAPVVRRDVQTICARSSGGFIGEQFCHARECRKAEHQADATCVRLREIDAARQQQGANR